MNFKKTLHSDSLQDHNTYAHFKVMRLKVQVKLWHLLYISTVCLDFNGIFFCSFSGDQVKALKVKVNLVNNLTENLEKWPLW